MTDPYAQLAAILWYLTPKDLDVLVRSGESLAVERFNSSWKSPPSVKPDSLS